MLTSGMLLNLSNRDDWLMPFSLPVNFSSGNHGANYIQTVKVSFSKQGWDSGPVHLALGAPVDGKPIGGPMLLIHGEPSWTTLVKAHPPGAWVAVWSSLCQEMAPCAKQAQAGQLLIRTLKLLHHNRRDKKHLRMLGYLIKMASGCLSGNNIVSVLDLVVKQAKTRSTRTIHLYNLCF
ncbi:hypothetical protein AMECASPLE_022262 [Ameca splendens]|uniref:Uncharacterized protein n=1 Tax=Ameca splendens TaxID=208324 RepID=A0ABV0XSN7_9TELE